MTTRARKNPYTWAWVLIGGLLLIICILLGLIAKQSLDSASNPSPMQTAATPTASPKPAGATYTPLPEPKPQVCAGAGDTVIHIAKPGIIHLLHIVGNAGGRYFGVTSYDARGEVVDLLVNTTDPYDGIKNLDLLEGESTALLEVKATGNWRITVLPITESVWAEHTINVPGSFAGIGDNVLFVSGEKSSTALIKGNAAGRYFGVIAYNGSAKILVNTTDPYQGAVLMYPDTAMIIVTAVGPWSIDVGSR